MNVCKDSDDVSDILKYIVSMNLKSKCNEIWKCLVNDKWSLDKQKELMKSIHEYSMTDLNTKLYNVALATRKCHMEKLFSERVTIRKVMTMTNAMLGNDYSLLRHNTSLPMNDMSNVIKSIKNTTFTSQNLMHMIDRNGMNINLSTCESFRKLGTVEGTPMMFCRTSVQNYSKEYATGVLHEILQLCKYSFHICFYICNRIFNIMFISVLGDMDDIVLMKLTPKLCILPVIAVLKYIILKANLFISHGKTLEQLNNGEEPKIIKFVATADGAAIVNSTITTTIINIFII